MLHSKQSLEKQVCEASTNFSNSRTASLSFDFVASTLQKSSKCDYNEQMLEESELNDKVDSQGTPAM
jgi:hypothetical protein